MRGERSFRRGDDFAACASAKRGSIPINRLGRKAGFSRGLCYAYVESAVRNIAWLAFLRPTSLEKCSVSQCITLSVDPGQDLWLGRGRWGNGGNDVPSPGKHAFLCIEPGSL